MEYLDIFARWGHGLFGITWIGLLYYFNFVQMEYFKEAGDGLPAAKAKLAPRALWWFRWGAMFTFITGLVLYYLAMPRANAFIMVGALMGTLMFLNVWLIIWPNQQVALGLKEGDAAAAGPKAALASRTNTLFSAPMLFGMFGSGHFPGEAAVPFAAYTGVGLWVAIAIVALLEANAIFGKMGPMASISGVIHMSLVLTAVLFGAIVFI